MQKLAMHDTWCHAIPVLFQRQRQPEWRDARGLDTWSESPLCRPSKQGAFVAHLRLPVPSKRQSCLPSRSLGRRQHWKDRGGKVPRLHPRESLGSPGVLHITSTNWRQLRGILAKRPSFQEAVWRWPIGLRVSCATLRQNIEYALRKLDVCRGLPWPCRFGTLLQCSLLNQCLQLRANGRRLWLSRRSSSSQLRGLESQVVLTHMPTLVPRPEGPRVA